MKTRVRMDPVFLQCQLLAFQVLGFSREIAHPKSTKKLTEAPGVMSVTSVCVYIYVRRLSSEQSLLFK